MYQEILRLLNFWRWNRSTGDNLHNKEMILINMRNVINRELREVRKEKKLAERITEEE